MYDSVMPTLTEFYVHFILHVDMSCYLEGHVMIGMASQDTIHFCPLHLMEEKL